MLPLLRRTLPLGATALLALLAASRAHAQLHLSWDDCSSGATARYFGCNTNTGGIYSANVLVGSFVSPGLTALIGEEAYVLVVSDVSSLPSWWRITNLDGSRPGCRPLLVLQPTFGDGVGISTCPDYFGSRGATGFVDVLPRAAANETLIQMVGGVPAESAGPVPFGEEDFAFTLRIRNDMTVGTPSCLGCLDSGHLVFIELRLLQAAGVGDVTLSPASDSGVKVSWQSSDFCYPYPCPPEPSLPTARTTWGSIKALYR